MKILQVVPFFSPVHGGSAIAPYYLSKELAKRGHEVTIFTSDYKLSREWEESADQVEVCSFKTWSSWTKLYVSPGMINRAREEIKHFDLIHMHNYRTFQNIVVHHYARKYGVPYVLQAHGSLPRIMLKQRLKWIYDVFYGYRLLRDASKTIAVTQTEAVQYEDMGVPKEKIAIIPNGIDLPEYKNLPPKGLFKKRCSIDDYEKVILYLGRIHKIKGLDFLVYAFKQVADVQRNVKLIIAGPDDGYLNKIRTIARTQGIESSVIFTGPLYDIDKLEAYVDADVVVNPAMYEVFGIVPLEAMMCGTPVIVTDNCGCSEIINEVNGGYTVKYGDIEGLKSRIINVLKDSPRLSELTKRMKRCLDWYEITIKIEKVYRECASNQLLNKFSSR